MNIGELFVQLGAIGNSKEVKAFGEAVKKAGKAIDDFDKKQNKVTSGNGKLNVSLGSSLAKFVGIVGAIAGAYYALDRLTESLAKQNQQWLLMAHQSDMAMSTLQKWDTVGKIVGIDGVGQQVQSLEQKLFNLRLTGEGAKGFQMGGIMPTNANDVMEQLRRRVSGMSNSSASFLLQQMGLDPKMLTLLRMTREEWEEYVKVQRQFTLTEKQRNDIEYMNRQLQVARIKIQYLKDRAIMAIMPHFVKLTKFLTDMALAVGKLVNWVIKAENPLSATIKLFIKLAAAIGVAKMALWAFSAHPIIAGITAIISALMLLADDIFGYNEGKDSLFGTIINGLKDLKLKNFLDFPVPKWLEYLIRVIDWVGRQSQSLASKVLGGVLPSINTTTGSGAGIGAFNPDLRPSSVKNITYNVQNDIMTNQPAQDIYNQLLYGNMGSLQY